MPCNRGHAVSNILSYTFLAVKPIRLTLVCSAQIWVTLATGPTISPRRCAPKLDMFIMSACDH